MKELRNDYIFDCEVFPNTFTMAVESVRTNKEYVFEISPRKNDLLKVLLFLDRLREADARMVGFNNIGYDYPVVHYLATQLKNHTDAGFITKKLYEKSQAIIKTVFDEEKRAHIIWPNDRIVKQVDLYKIHHFDNKARMTSLKVLEFNLRMDNIQETPIEWGKHLAVDEIDILIGYNKHDVKATRLFYDKSQDMLQFRDEMSARFGKDFTNHNDAKIGNDYFIIGLEKALGKDACFVKNEEGKRKPRQTIRKQIALKDVIFDYVKFETPQFQAVHEWMCKRVIKQTKAVFTEFDESLLGSLEPYTNKKKTKGMIKNLNCIIDGVQVDFGTGGIHASIEASRVHSDDEMVIVDLDVASYYPNLAIKNRLFPEHLTEKFCDIYNDLYVERGAHPKGTMLNLAIKLALNAAFGNSNNQFSVFYDSQFTMAITINGQLLLCMLYEGLRNIEGLQLIQMNTDGVTVRLPRSAINELKSVKSWWELMTGLELEDVIYSSMFIRDVNNYVAISESGKVKTKGAYVSTPGWHQNHSAIVIAKAAEENLVKGVDLKEFIVNYNDDYGFLLRTKVPRTSRLVSDWGFDEVVEQNVCRYYMANSGAELVKIMPPLAKAKNPTKERRISVHAGYPVEICNRFTGIDRSRLNVDWYVGEAKKLTKF
jgi:hypothetical protein